MVALSFDDGPDPDVTPRLLHLLDEWGVKAIFFLVGEKAKAYPELVQWMIRSGHEIGNHTWSHDTLLMLKGEKRISLEISRTQRLFKRFGIVAKAFRPPVGITAPSLCGPLMKHGLCCVNYRCRAMDAGNRRIQNLSGRILKKVQAGDLILLHDIKPSKGSVDELMGEFEYLLSGLQAKGLTLVRASQLLGKNLMERQPTSVLPPNTDPFGSDDNAAPRFAHRG